MEVGLPRAGVPMSSLVNLSSLIDDAKCYALVRQHRWPDGVRCPHVESAAVARHGRTTPSPSGSAYRCRVRGSRFDDLSGPFCAGATRRYRSPVLCLYFIGLNLSNRQIARELDLGVSDVQAINRAAAARADRQSPGRRPPGWGGE